MVDYFFGKPRTGKTYRAVDYIYKQYLNEDSSPSFTFLLTNIQGFKFDFFNQKMRDKGSKSLAYKIVWKEFYDHLKVLYEMALEDKTDEELNRYAYHHQINDALIVLDEVSLYLKKYDDVLSWFFAYHGHFKIRIILIAQSPKQINSDYLVHAETYIEAQPQSKQLSNKKLRYIHYSDIYFNKQNKFGSDTLTTKDEIYKLYKSGEVDKPKKILYKFMFYMFIALIVSFSIFKFLLYRLSPEILNNDNNDSHISQNTYDTDSVHDYKKVGNLIVFRCDSKYCWLTNTDYIHKEISKSYLKFVLLLNEIDLTYFEIKNEIFMLKNQKRGQEKITLASLTDYYYLIPKSVKETYLKELFNKKHDNSKRKPMISNNVFSSKQSDVSE